MATRLRQSTFQSPNAALYAFPPKSVAQTILDCPIWLDALIQQMLDPDPDKRPRTAMAVLMALEETKKNLARGTTVTEHAAGGLSPLQLNTSRSEAKKVLGVVEEKMAVPLTERPWFSFAVFISFLVIMFAGLTWMFWPLSAEQLLDRGVALIETGKPITPLMS